MAIKLFESLFELVTYDLGIDLGTANTMVYMRNYGIVVSEPSVVAMKRGVRQFLL
jgi:rod shape-determining protein MreB